MRTWIEFMPLFVVRLLASHCERMRVGSRWVHAVRPGVMIECEERQISGPVIVRFT